MAGLDPATHVFSRPSLPLRSSSLPRLFPSPLRGGAGVGVVRPGECLQNKVRVSLSRVGEGWGEGRPVQEEVPRRPSAAETRAFCW